MKSTKAEELTGRDDHRPAFDCDLSAEDDADEMCTREYLRTHVPVLV